MRLSIFWWVIFTFSFCSLRAQCDATKLINEYVSSLEEYSFLKGYKFVDPKPTNEYSYVLTKGTSYIITICLPDDKAISNVEMMVFDRSRKLVVSNENNKRKKKNVLEFTCKATGIYYMRYNFVDEPKFCGAGVLAFKR